jgi:hypothetical protein
MLIKIPTIYDGTCRSTNHAFLVSFHHNGVFILRQDRATENARRCFRPCVNLPDLGKICITIVDTGIRLPLYQSLFRLMLCRDESDLKLQKSDSSRHKVGLLSPAYKRCRKAPPNKTRNNFLHCLLISETFYHICNTGMKTNTIHKLWWWQFGQS